MALGLGEALRELGGGLGPCPHPPQKPAAEQPWPSFSRWPWWGWQPRGQEFKAGRYRLSPGELCLGSGHKVNKSDPLVRNFTVSPEGHLAPDRELSSQSGSDTTGQVGREDRGLPRALRPSPPQAGALGRETSQEQWGCRRGRGPSPRKSPARHVGALFSTASRRPQTGTDRGPSRLRKRAPMTWRSPGLGWGAELAGTPWPHPRLPAIDLARSRGRNRSVPQGAREGQAWRREELGGFLHVVPDRVGQNHHAALALLQLLGRLHGHRHGAAGTATCREGGSGPRVPEGSELAGACPISWPWRPW